jgi:hypothetical protein
MQEQNYREKGIQSYRNKGRRILQDTPGEEEKTSKRVTPQSNSSSIISFSDGFSTYKEYYARKKEDFEAGDDLY